MRSFALANVRVTSPQVWEDMCAAFLLLCEAESAEAPHVVVAIRLRPLNDSEASARQN